jgi:hypothetical protein
MSGWPTSIVEQDLTVQLSIERKFRGILGCLDYAIKAIVT